MNQDSRKGSFFNNENSQNQNQLKLKKEKIINRELNNNLQLVLTTVNKVIEELNIVQKNILQKITYKFQQSKMDSGLSNKKSNDLSLVCTLGNINNEVYLNNFKNEDINITNADELNNQDQKKNDTIQGQNQNFENNEFFSPNKNEDNSNIKQNLNIDKNDNDQNNNRMIESQKKQLDQNTLNENNVESNTKMKFFNKIPLTRELTYESISNNSSNAIFNIYNNIKTPEKNSDGSVNDNKDIYLNSINSNKISVEVIEASQLDYTLLDPIHEENSQLNVSAISEQDNCVNDLKLSQVSNGFSKMMQSSNQTQDNNSKRIKKQNSIKERPNLDMNDEYLRKLNELEISLNKDDRMVLVLSYNLDLIFYNQMSCHELLIDKNELKDKPVAQIVNPNSYKYLSSQIKNVIKIFFQDTEFKIIKKLEDIIVFQDKSLQEMTYSVTAETYPYRTKLDSKSCMIILYCTKIINITNNQVIDQSSSFQIVYSLFLLIIIIFLLAQVPQDISFGNDSLIEFNSISDNVITVIFSIDIIINLFVSQKDDDGNDIQDYTKTAYHYASTTMYLDIIATFPLYELMEFNTSIIKSIKIAKIIKIIKIIKISKIITIRYSNLKDQFGEEFVLALKRSFGFFSLIGQNINIIVFSHFYTAFQQQVKCNFIENDPEDKTWLLEQYGVEGLTNFETYCFLLQEDLKIALGLGAIPLSNPLEVAIQMAWMFLGMSMFGQAIGNISSQLNFYNHNEVEKLDNISFFTELCEIQNIDPRIKKMLKTEIENHQENFNETNLLEKCKILSIPLVKQLENYVQKNFISSFKLLSRLSLDSVRLMKNNLKINRGKFKMIKGSNMTELFFITKGSLKLQQESMNIKNIYESNDIYGFTDWVNQCNIRYDFELEQMLKIDDEKDMWDDDGQFFSNKHNLDIVNECRNLVEQSNMMKTNFEPLETTEQTPVSIVTFQYIPVSSDDLEQFSLPYSIIDQILINDFSSFISIWGQWRSQNKVISPSQIKDINLTLSLFDTFEFSGIIINDKGIVVRQNKAFYENYNNYTEQINNIRITDIIQYETLTESKVTDIQNLENKDYMILLNKDQKILRIYHTERKLIKLNNQRKRSNSLHDRFEQCNLKKSLIDAKIIQFEIRDI